ncbi:MAG TPA: HNH endonuclease [Candidatus Baltobacteraceae bacterium]|jgi:5-methylcytosine-specific restriction endonuclease McrA
MAKVYDWDAIQRYHDEGNTFVECQRHFGFSHTAWVKALKRGDLHSGTRQYRDRRRQYAWSAVQAYYDEGHTYRECRKEFGFCAAAWTKAVNRGELHARARSIPLILLLATGKSRGAIKRRLLLEGILKNVCSMCELQDWQGRPLSMHIDHVNGQKNDHRLENLRMLCPNCHSQTETYGGRNVKRAKRLQDPAEVV